MDVKVIGSANLEIAVCKRQNNAFEGNPKNVRPKSEPPYNDCSRFTGCFLDRDAMIFQLFLQVGQFREDNPHT